MGYVSKTYSSIVGGGEPMNAIEFKTRYAPTSKYKPKPCWRLRFMALERKHVSDSYGVDCVLLVADQTNRELFKKALSGEPIPASQKQMNPKQLELHQKCPNHKRSNPWRSRNRVAAETANLHSNHAEQG
jgi:hypothetical protein